MRGYVVRVPLHGYAKLNLIRPWQFIYQALAVLYQTLSGLGSSLQPAAAMRYDEDENVCVCVRERESERCARARAYLTTI